MKIKTITCHDVYNYGASLQAYALMKFLQKQGHDAKIIDYKPDYLCGRYNVWHINPESHYYDLCKRNKIVHFLYCLKKVKSTFTTYKRKSKFDSFKKNNLVVTSITYHSYEELKNNPPEAGLFIAGSDQIWNTSSDNGKDPAFYLDFVKEKSKKASYAASFGVSQIQEEWKSFVRSMIENINYVSVREETGLRILENMGLKGEVVLDPVFLLAQEEWKKLIRNKYSEKYVLVYDFLHNDPELKELAITIAQKNNWKIYSMNDYIKTDYADKNISNAGPIEFLEYINSAQLVISSSFHATAFSIILNKQFFVFKLKGYGNSSRMTDLLNRFNINNRLVNGEVNIHDKILNYTLINQRINQKVTEAQRFLNSITPR